MKPLLTLVFMILFLLIKAQDCESGYVQKEVSCGSKKKIICVPTNYTCNDCWQVHFPNCDGNYKVGGGTNTYDSYDAAYKSAERHKSDELQRRSKGSKCFVFDESQYEIDLYDCGLYGSGNTSSNDTKKKDLLANAKSLIQRLGFEIINYKRNLSQQSYLPGGTIVEYHDRLDQAEQNKNALESLINNINSSSLDQIENIYNNLLSEEGSLKQTFESLDNQPNNSNNGNQDSPKSYSGNNSSNSNNDNSEYDKLINEKEQRQAKIDAIMSEVNTKSKTQSAITSGILDGIGSIFNSIQMKEIKKNIEYDDKKRERQFEKLRTQIQNEDGILVECNHCGGEGYNDCNSCNKKGNKKCMACSGNAGKECSVCKGSGLYKVGSISLSCTSCYGKGVKNCSICSNTGETICLNCKGLGKTQCNYCYGTGQEFERK